MGQRKTKRSACLGALAMVLGATACTTVTPTVEEPVADVQTPLQRVAPLVPMPSAALSQTAPITRLAFGSCLKQEDDQSIWSIVGAVDPDVFLFIGDNVYGDVYDGDDALPELRQAYFDLAQSEAFSAFRGSTPLMVTWDDHDFGLNDAGGSFPLKYGAEAIFEEAWALPATDPRRQRDGVYHSQIIGPPGQRVQIILLDTRFFRSDLMPTDERNAPGKERYVPDLDPTKTMLGEAQYEWLLEELLKPADVRIIASSIQVIAEGHGWEAWRTLPQERQKLYDVISSSGAERVVLLSGDRHSGALYKTDEALTYPLYEITSSSLNAPSSTWRKESGETRVEPGPNRLGSMEYDVNFGVVDIDWEQRFIRLDLRGADGSSLQRKTIRFGEIEHRD